MISIVGALVASASAHAQDDMQTNPWSIIRANDGCFATLSNTNSQSAELSIGQFENGVMAVMVAPIDWDARQKKYLYNFRIGSAQTYSSLFEIAGEQGQRGIISYGNPSYGNPSSFRIFKMLLSSSPTLEIWGRGSKLEAFALQDTKAVFDDLNDCTKGKEMVVAERKNLDIFHLVFGTLPYAEMQANRRVSKPLDKPEPE